MIKRSKRFGMMTILLFILFVFTGCASKFDVSGYTDTYWSTDGIDYTTGGYVLEIYIPEENSEIAVLDFGMYGAYPNDSVAIISQEVKLSDITSNKIALAFDEDGWGHCGEITFTLNETEILFEISDVELNESGFDGGWGLYNTSGVLVNNPFAYDNLYYEPDLSTASGILASLGMTEEEFKASCAAISYPYDVDYKYSELIKNPNNYVGSFFYDKMFKVHKEIGITGDGYRCYLYDAPYCHAIAIDYRDDVYSPTITGGFEGFYMIFEGLQNLEGTDYAIFDLIAIDEE